MIEKWQNFKGWYDQRVLREQIIIACVALLLVYLLVDFFVLHGINKDKKALQARLDAAQTDISVIATQKSVLIDGLRNNPGIAKQRELTRLKERVTELEVKIDELSVGLVSAEKLPEVIRDVLTTEENLNLLGLVANKPEELILHNQSAEAEGDFESVGVYKYSVIFRVSGRYHNLMSYLKKLEASPWRFYWDELDYQVDRYPNAVAQITAYTLSTDEGFIDE